MSDRISHPTQLYDFTAFSQTRPNQQLPGDRLDAQFSDHAKVLNEVIVALNNDEARLVTKDDLAPELIDSLTRDVLLRTGVDAQAAAGAAMTSIHSAATALEAAIQSEASAVKASADAEVVRQGQGSVLSALEQLGAVASGHAITLMNAKATVDNSANDAAKASAIAQDYAVLAQAWAENMPDTIPPNILAANDITGEHWSSRWWANQSDISSGVSEDWANNAASAAEAAKESLDNFNALYLGPHPVNPTLDNSGNPLQLGAVYYNTSDGNMYVWSGSIWQVSSAAVGWVPEAPINNNVYVRSNAAWVLSAGGVAEAPNDGKVYARKSINWTLLNSNDVTFDTGPATVTGAVNLKADQSALAAETTARINGDQASTSAIANLKASQVANDSSVSGATVKDALNTNQAAIVLKAPLASPAFSGTPTAPTPAPTDSSTTLPTTAWVQAAIALKSSLVVQDAPPSTPIDNGLWWESDTAKMWLRYNDGNSSQWVQVNAQADMGNYATVTAMQAGDALKVAKAGDTMTGGLTISQPGGASVLTLNKAAPTALNTIYGQYNGVNRWAIYPGNGVNETGAGNTGSNFSLTRFDDNGAVLDSPLSISRSSGNATFSGAVIITNPFAAAGDEAIQIAPASGAPSIAMNKPAGQANNLWGRTAGGVNRWVLQLGNGSAETGGNVGSDFVVARYNDATGAYIDTPLSITRSNATANFSQAISVGATIYAASSITSNGTIQANQNFQSSTAAAVLATTGAGTVYLRPQGAGSGAGQAYLGSDGTFNGGSLNMSGGATVQGAFLTASGQMISRCAGSGNAQYGMQDSAGTYRSYVYWQGTSGHAYWTNVSPGSNMSLAANGDVNCVPAGGHNFIVSPGAGFQAGGGVWGALSDERIKTVQSEYSLGLDEVCALRPVIYTYKGNDQHDPDNPSMHAYVAEQETPFVGLIAQEVETIFPSMVIKQEGVIDGEAVSDLRTLNTSELIYALVNAVKTLSTRVADLEAGLGAR